MSPLLLMIVVLLAIGMVGFLALIVVGNRKYKYKVIIHKLDGNRVVPAEWHEAKLEALHSVETGYEVVLRTRKGKRIPIVGVESNRVVAGRFIDTIIEVFTPDDIQYFPVKTSVLGRDIKKYPDFSKNAQAISAAINVIRYAKMLRAKFWQQLLNIGIPVFMVMLLVGGAVTMYVYASDYSKNVKEASLIVANATNNLIRQTSKMAEISKQSLIIAERALNRTGGSIPIEAVPIGNMT